MSKRIVLAYSGGLDTSVAIGWIAAETGAEVICVAADVGQGGEDLEAIRQRGMDCGAVDSVVLDLKTEFAEQYCLPALLANGLYLERYPLVSALSRPVIAKHLALAAQEFGADTVAHGCTGKGNDQVRFEVGIGAIAPDLKVLAPVRDSGMTRDKAIQFAEDKGLPIDQSSDRRTRWIRTSGGARWRPASWRTRGMRRSRMSIPTRQIRRCRGSRTRWSSASTTGYLARSTGIR